MSDWVDLDALEELDEETPEQRAEALTDKELMYYLRVLQAEHDKRVAEIQSEVRIGGKTVEQIRDMDDDEFSKTIMDEHNFDPLATRKDES